VAQCSGPCSVCHTPPGTLWYPSDVLCNKNKSVFKVLIVWIHPCSYPMGTGLSRA
jgi:hypothetical protein